MLYRLALKELRETFWLALVALVIQLYFVAAVTGSSLASALGSSTSLYAQTVVPFAHTDFVSTFAIVAGCLAAGLGFWQTVGESVRGTYALLLHRPVPRWQVIGVKLAVGLGLYLVCSAVPILLYAFWAATPGTHASPFYWSMTLTSWQVWLTMPLVYLGAFLAGLRSARWYGTRLLPLATAGGAAGLIVILPWWALTGLPLLVVATAALLSAIFFVTTTSDFQ
jgi:ABC-type transport system involved in multi-copper enzyme maturation permease subunit